MKCEFFGCPNTEDVQEVTIGPGTNIKLCPTCTASEFSMCDQPCGDGCTGCSTCRGPSTPGSLGKDDREYFDNHAV